MGEYYIRKGNLEDIEQISELERICFPASEAATKDILKKRLEKYPNYFYVLLVSEQIVSMVNGMVSNEIEVLISLLYVDCYPFYFIIE